MYELQPSCHVLFVPAVGGAGEDGGEGFVVHLNSIYILSVDNLTINSHLYN
jgi:hypothetical protein